jgi:hypothetical protein
MSWVHGALGKGGQEEAGLDLIKGGQDRGLATIKELKSLGKFFSGLCILGKSELYGEYCRVKVGHKPL